MDALDVDEMVGQVLASEGFAQVEELAYVDASEIAGIDGFDDETAEEIQNRAKEYLEKLEAEMDAKRKELGVEDEPRRRTARPSVSKACSRSSTCRAPMPRR